MVGLRRFSRQSGALAALGMALCGAGALPTPVRAQASGTISFSSLPLWEPDRAVTTGIRDALPTVTFLKGVRSLTPLPIPDNWVLAPGYYRATVRSYCLHAGAYGPTQGDGYLIAPLKGDRAPIIRNVLLRSIQFPDILQQDIQRLLWGIEDGAAWSSFNDAFKQRVAPLLTAQELAVLNLEPKRAALAGAVKKRLGGLIPGGVKETIDRYAELRDRITRTADFEELERFAVRTGVAPWGKDSRRDVDPGVWAYVGDGFFLRAYPERYPTTVLEIYRVAPAVLTRDAKGRITRFDSDGFIIDTTYDDTPTTETVDGKPTPVWRFKSVIFRHPDGRTHTIENAGFIVASARQIGVRVATAGGAPLRLQGDLGDMGHYQNGLNKATNLGDLGGKTSWIADHLNRVGGAYDQANSALNGLEPPTDPKPRGFDPSSHTATPANTSKQRLALSGFKK